MAHTLVVIRHAKSDWDVDAADRDRPLAAHLDGHVLLLDGRRGTHRSVTEVDDA